MIGNLIEQMKKYEQMKEEELADALWTEFMVLWDKHLHEQGPKLILRVNILTEYANFKEGKKNA